MTPDPTGHRAAAHSFGDTPVTDKPRRTIRQDSYRSADYTFTVATYIGVALMLLATFLPSPAGAEDNDETFYVGLGMVGFVMLLRTVIVAFGPEDDR